MNRYYDNAATSFPKPPEVSEAIAHYLNHDGAPYGRSFYQRAFNVSSTVENCRDILADTLGINSPERVTFTPNATFAINAVLKNFPYKYKRVFISPMEHNSVMRPLHFLKETRGIEFDFLPAYRDGLVNLEALNNKKSSILDKIDLVVISHMSNVNGVVQPVKELKKIIGKIPLLLDGAQSAGHEEIFVDEWDIDFIAVTGHKSLLGPTGTGALYTSKKYNLIPFIHGGTGSNSEFITMPNEYPDIFEAGTPNIAGIYGLLAALKNRPVSLHSKSDFTALLKKISSITDINLYISENPDNQGELFSITHKKITPSVFAMKLYREYGIETRVGLHCAPCAHQYLGTSPQGSVRFALSPYHDSEDLDFLYNAIKETSYNG